MPGIITLLTDFGTADEYVGVVKGVILTVNPEAKIVDITHHIDPQDVIQAAYMLLYSYRYFPMGTIHVAVVDPGVGTKRRILAAKAQGHFFLAPDNGLLFPLLENAPIETIVSVENSGLFLENVGNTFHGRDIFGPVAGHLSRKIPLEKLGTRMDLKQIRHLELPRITGKKKGSLEGEIIRVDRFGNLITNIDEKSICNLQKSSEGKQVCARIGQSLIEGGLRSSYEEVEKGQPLLIIGSRGLMEIAVGSANASKVLNAGKKDRLTVFIQ